MRESKVERYLKDQIELRGGRCVKHVSPGEIGEPDRLCKLPGYWAFLVEVKAPGQKPRKTQERNHSKWKSAGMNVYVCESIQAVDALMRLYWVKAE